MAAKKRHSFRLSESQADTVTFALLYFLASFNDESRAPIHFAYKAKAEEIYNKLQNYQWEVQENE